MYSVKVSFLSFYVVVMRIDLTSAGTSVGGVKIGLDGGVIGVTGGVG